MKIDREYPATHSMSTSWFGIDNDGNVAIIDFNENGPVPSFLGEESTESIIEDVLPIEIADMKTCLSFTDQQAQHLIDAMVDADANNPIEFPHIVQIDPSKTERFLMQYDKNSQKDTLDSFASKLLCLSSEYGIYILECYAWDEKDVKALYEEKILLKCKEYHLYCDEKWNDEEHKWEFKMDLKNLPFFHYQQPDWPGQLIERTYVPKFPLKASQLDLISQKIALHFPFSFKTQEQFQISEFTPCQSHDGGAFFDVAPGSSNRIPYPGSDGGIVNVDENSYPEAMSDTPRIIILDDTQRYNYLHLSKELPFISSSVVFACFRDKNNPSNRISDSTGFDELCGLFESNRDRFENIVETTRPYCAIAMPKSLEVIRKFYNIEDGEILIRGSKIPLLTMDNAKNNLKLIEQYCSMPYRGLNLKRIADEL